MKSKWAKLLAIALVIVLVWPLLCGVWVKNRIERRMKMPIKGTYVPVFFAPTFYLRNAEFEMRGKVRLVSGHLKVDYNPLTMILGDVVRVRLTSDKIQVQLLGAWQDLQGVQDALVDHFEAEVGIGPKGLAEIYAVDIKSQSFQFQIKNSEV